MTNDTRAAFEAWWKKRRKQTWMDQRCRGDAENPPDGWSSAFEPHAWEGWQAAYLASRRAALDEALRECEEVADHWDAMHNTQASMAADQCVVAIRALGDEGVKP